MATASPSATAPSGAPNDAPSAGHEIEGVGTVEGIASAKSKAEALASQIREDRRSGNAEPLGKHVVYEDHDGPDKGKTAWVKPPTLNAKGKGNCNSITRAAAHGMEAEDGSIVATNPSHVAVVDVPQPPGKPPVQHSFLIAEPGPGDAPLHTDGDGKVIGEIPKSRIIDPNIAKGANGGKPLPHELYQGAAIEPIAKPGEQDTSHLTADPAHRAAEGNAYQGIEREHAPLTPEGVRTATVSHIAARLVTPPPEHVPRPLDELYPTHHPVLDEAGREIIAIESTAKRALGFRPTLRMAEQYKEGLARIARGENPAPLPSDPPITKEHADAAADLHDHLMDLAGVQRAPAAGGPDSESVQNLAVHAVSLKTGDRTDPKHDVKATQTAEVEAIIPGAVPATLRQHIARPTAGPGAAPPALPPAPAPKREIELPAVFDEAPARRRSVDLLDLEDVLPLSADDDREEDLGVLGSATWLALFEALDDWGCGHPGDGRRRAPPPRKVDARLGGFGWEGGFGQGGAAYRRDDRFRRGDDRFRRDQGNDWRDRDRDRNRRGGGQTTEDAEVRSGGSNTAPELGVLRAGTNVETIGQRGQWTRVRWSTNDAGWRGEPGITEGWIMTETIGGEPRLGGFWDWRRHGVIDRVLVDEPSFRRAYNAATTSAWAVRRLLAGGTVYGYDLATLQAGATARGLSLPDALTPDPSLQGPGHFHGGGFGGFHHGWQSPVIVPVYGSQCVDPTDPTDPCYDPRLGGVGDDKTDELLSQVKAHRAATEGGACSVELPAVFNSPTGAPSEAQTIADMASALRSALSPAHGPAPRCSTGLCGA